jgi:threonine/homoserine/homoserine lactone efflux protein
MGLIEIIPLVLIMAVGAFIPSSSVALVVTRSLTHGIPNGISVSMGIVVGDAIFILLVVFGLSVVAESMGWLFLAIKYIGATYLIWLGLRCYYQNQQPLQLKKSNKRRFCNKLFCWFIFNTG